MVGKFMGALFFFSPPWPKNSWNSWYIFARKRQWMHKCPRRCVSRLLTRPADFRNSRSKGGCTRYPVYLAAVRVAIWLNYWPTGYQCTQQLPQCQHSVLMEPASATWVMGITSWPGSRSLLCLKRGTEKGRKNGKRTPTFISRDFMGVLFSPRYAHSIPPASN